MGLDKWAFMPAYPQANPRLEQKMTRPTETLLGHLKNKEPERFAHTASALLKDEYLPVRSFLFHNGFACLSFPAARDTGKEPGALQASRRRTVRSLGTVL